MKHWMMAVLLGVVTFALVIVQQRDVGITRDETIYFAAGDRYVDWWFDLAHGRPALFDDAIRGHFEGVANNSEHPPLMKTLFGLSHRLLHGGLGVDELTSYRAPTAALHGALVAIVYLWTTAIWGAAEGLLAALLLILMPRLLFHAGLACFDAPMVAVWFGTVAAYWKALGSRRWAIGAGVAFGLALATKHNALLLPFALIAHSVVVGWAGMRADWGAWRAEIRGQPIARQAGATWRLFVRRQWRHERLALWSMAIVGPLVLVFLWPWLWFDPIAHVRAWIGFHLNHVHYNYEYLGDNWNHPRFPWHVPIVTTLYTVPVVTLAAAALGARVLIARGWRQFKRVRVGDGVGVDVGAVERPGLLLLLSAGAAFGPFLLGSTPIFGAEKHWAPAMPALAIVAGIGVVWAARQLAAWVVTLNAAWADPLAGAGDGVRRACVMALGLIVCAAAAVEVRAAQPYPLSNYNALAGGAPGGADHGMNRQFWGHSALGVVPFLEAQQAEAGRPLRVYTHEASLAWPWYQKFGTVPTTLADSGNEDSGVASSDLAIVVHELHFNRHDFMIWKAYGTVQPVFVLRADGVPIVSVYKRPAKPPTTPLPGR
jgi:hypothetical protein